jgi:guanyl-specific ribonuclease Sa
LADVQNHLIDVLPRADRWLARMPARDNGSRRDQRAALRWLVILAALTIGTLVLALGQVSHQAVRQGEVLRTATAANTAAFWSCHGTHSRELRDSCLAQLNLPNLAPSVADATLQGQPQVAVDLGAPSGRR